MEEEFTRPADSRVKVKIQSLWDIEVARLVSVVRLDTKVLEGRRRIFLSRQQRNVWILRTLLVSVRDGQVIGMCPFRGVYSVSYPVFRGSGQGPR